MSAYDAVRAAVTDAGTDSRVEVNQRALIDKILARYASAGAVYRELLQNSNDAEASTAEIRFTTSAFDSFAGDSSSPSDGGVVTQVAYRNDGHPFRPQDWSRLRKIAEGNPDVAKVGAFGVGAYTMFSIAEEPLVISGKEALAFFWKGDALWTKTGPAPNTGKGDGWTTFVLPSRDPYPVPDLIDFGKFLCTNLTFTQCLCTVRVYVNDLLRMTIAKSQLERPRVVKPPQASSWWRNDGAVTCSSRGIFSLGSKDGSITESVMRISASIDGETSCVNARYVSGVAHTKVPSDMAKKMFRVTKKAVPPSVNVQIFIHARKERPAAKNKASAITDSFSPAMGSGRIFIGFRTSQTTGLAAHLAAPFVPTVEREAIDLQDAALRIYNTELLEISGILMRLLLEHAMGRVGLRWEKNMDRYAAEDERLRKEIQSGASNPERKEKKKVNKKSDEGESEKEKSSSSLFGFAKYMAHGMKKKIVDVIKTVEEAVYDESAELLNPPDTRPLSEEEHDAIVLMRSFCPQQSTPDTNVGAAIAAGFSRCMPNLSPPVLTRTGVVRGRDAKLPNKGMESFVKMNVVRKVMFENAKEYHEVISGASPLSIENLAATLKEGTVLEETDVVRLLKWWTKYQRIDPNIAVHGRSVKESILFYPKTGSGDASNIQNLKNSTYYADRKILPDGVPLPDSVIPKHLQEQLGRVLEDPAMRTWFLPIPVDVWVTFVAEHRCMTDGIPEDDKTRMLVITALSKEYNRKEGHDRATYVALLRNLLADKRCIPYEVSKITPSSTADCPADLYLQSAELTAFVGIHSFRKVSLSLRDAGVSDDFLLALGVRQTVSVDFLFAHLDTLEWSDNPQPLIQYLQKANLSRHDLEKLRTTQYLPERSDKSRTYAPSELYLPNPDLDIFPFIRFLQWPTLPLPEKSADGAFLRNLGCRVNPPLQTVMKFVENAPNGTVRVKCLDFLYDRLGPNGPYTESYSPPSPYMKRKILPCIKKDPLGLANKPQKEVLAPDSCFHDIACICMGFPIVDPDLERNGREYGRRFRCQPQPDSEILAKKLLQIVSEAKSHLNKIGGNEYKYKEYCDQVCAAFDNIFNFLSTKQFDQKALRTLKENAFVPCRTGDFVEWYLPADVYFRNTDRDKSTLTETLFHVVDFHPFLSAVGVKSEPSNEDIMQLILSDPRAVLGKLGSEEKYLLLLRRIAADPPFKTPTKEITESPFLIALQVDDTDKNGASAKYVLAKSQEISIIDNSFLGRMFPVLQAPHESDLEDFYIRLGSNYISKSVGKAFHVLGGQRHKTELTLGFAKRLKERRPLLISSSVTSRPLVKDAASVLDDGNLDIIEASALKAVYSLGKTVKEQDVSCFADSIGRRKNALYLTKGFDWFDVGNAIGGLILQRCQLEDAFLIGSLLEAPLEQLRARGFPVDRVLRIKPIEKPQQPIPVSDSGSDTAATSPSDANVADDGFDTIMQQMFPDCDKEYIRRQLGDKPSLDKVQKIAEKMAFGNYPKNSTSQENETKGSKSPARKVGKKLGQMLTGKRGSPMTGAMTGSKFPTQVMSHAQHPPGNSSIPTTPQGDVSANKRIEDMLKNSVQASRKVNPRGVSAPDTVVTSIPEGLERGSNGCEKISGQDLKPFSGPYETGMTQNGIKVFTSRKQPSSESFLLENFHAVDSFANVMEDLCHVYSLNVASVAIYHDPSGNTIAFNSNRSLHFNVRYFCSLHHMENAAPDSSCYSYWFTTMAHELAHNLVSAHNKDHAYYTESYVTLFLPKLAVLLYTSSIL